MAIRYRKDGGIDRRRENILRLRADPEFQRKLRDAQASPEFGRAVSEARRRRFEDPVFSAKHSAYFSSRMRDLMQDEAFRAKQAASMRHRRPAANALPAMTPRQRRKYKALRKCEIARDVAITEALRIT